MSNNNVTNTVVMANWDGDFCLDYYGPCWSDIFSQYHARNKAQQEQKQQQLLVK